MVVTDIADTDYRHETACRNCDRTFTATVRRRKVPPENGDYLKDIEHTVHSHCPDCRVTRANRLVRRCIDLDDASLTWRGRLRHTLGLDESPTMPSQSEQIDMLLDTLSGLEDPIEGGVDWVIHSDQDCIPFYHAKQQLDSEHYAELQSRASEEFGVDVDELAGRGRKSVRDGGR